MGSAPKWIRRWAGGRVRQGKHGEEVFVLRQPEGSKTLKVKTEDEALAELALYRRDPAWYFRDRDDTVPRLTEESLEEFIAFKQSKRCGRVTREHLECVLRHYLTDWMSLFGERDLREFKPIDADRWLKKPVNGKPKRSIVKRITSLKSYTDWLRKTYRLNRQSDWTLDLETPKEEPEKSIEEKTYEIPHVEAVYRNINKALDRESDAQSIRDVIRIAACTGLHMREIDRIARQRDENGNPVGEIKRLENQPAPIFGTFCVWHKKGFKHRIAVDQATYEAALRLQARGNAPDKRYVHRYLDRAA